MKKFKFIIKNVFYLIIFALLLVGLIYSAKLFHELNTSPDLLEHVFPNDGRPGYYVVQNDLIKKWESYCLIVVIIVALSLAFTLILLTFHNVTFIRNFNIANVEKRNHEKIEKIKAKKQARIAQLQADLEELKKD